MSKTILIVDDSNSVRSVVGLTLKGAGYEVIEACDGKDALAKMTGQKIHLIVSDVNMPNMDGIKFIQEIGKLENYSSTPICMLTTETEQSKLESNAEISTDAWITKPVQPARVIDIVSGILPP